MDFPQSVVSPPKSSSVFPESDKQNSNYCVENPSILSREIDVGNGIAEGNLEDSLGALEVYIHQARDIHNICIYQNQDVYAKLCLTSDPEEMISTKIINGGGRNPIFNESLSLNVRKIDSSLKCEIWMLSRVRNYLEDQLLGFALVPVSEILLHDGKLDKEFSLSSTDLVHSPAGFVQLSISYIGTQPEVMEISAPRPMCMDTSDPVNHDLKSIQSLCDELEKIEFPDPNIVNENCQMVEEYIRMPCTNADSPDSDNLVVCPESENQLISEIQNEEISVGSKSSKLHPEIGSPPSSVSTCRTFVSPPVTFESSETPKDSKSPNEEHISTSKDNSEETSANEVEAKDNASGELSNTVGTPVVTVTIEPEPKVVQQDIVDMYMKSMQQFTDSLAKVKLDFESGPPSSENSSSDKNTPDSKTPGSRVFYGSRAFF